MTVSSVNVNTSKSLMDNFISGDFELVGEYPSVPPEVMAVFTGMIDGLIDQIDITADSVIVATKVWDAWFSHLPSPASTILYAYCIGYMADKADDIYDIIGDTRVFELPEFRTPTLKSPHFDLAKGDLDKVFKDLKKKLKKLWPDDETKSQQSKHTSQVNDLSKLEEELKDVMDFINNPTAPFDEEYNRALKKIKDLKADISQFLENVKDSAEKLKNLSFDALAKLNDALFAQLTASMQDNIQSCCSAMISFLSAQLTTIENLPIEDYTMESAEEEFRLNDVIEKLNALKEDSSPMKDYVNNYVRKKDIKALSISIENQKHIESLRQISIKYQEDSLTLDAVSTDVSTVGEGSYKLKVALVEGERFCDCIRIFNKIETVDNDLKKLYYEGVKLYVESNFTDMKKYEINMFVSCIAKSAQPAGTSFNDVKRMHSMATEIISDTEDIIKTTENSESVPI